jgi:RNA polymerase sigma factor (sigma-70 family)
MLRDPDQKEAGFRGMMDAYQERLYRLIFRMTGRHEDTDDLLQEIFVKAWIHLDRFGGHSTLYTWLYRIAINETLRFLERRARHRTLGLDEVPGIVGTESESDFPLLSENTWRSAMALLPPRQRLVFGLRYYEEMDYRQMAQLLELTEGSLKASFHHAVKKIRQYLEQHPD